MNRKALVISKSILVFSARTRTVDEITACLYNRLSPIHLSTPCKNSPSSGSWIICLLRIFIHHNSQSSCSRSNTQAFSPLFCSIFYVIMGPGFFYKFRVHTWILLCSHFTYTLLGLFSALLTGNSYLDCNAQDVARPRQTNHRTFPHWMMMQYAVAISNSGPLITITCELSLVDFLFSTTTTTTMSIPDAQIHPHATGPAEAIVAKHQEPQDLVFYAGWVSRLRLFARINEPD